MKKLTSKSKSPLKIGVFGHKGRMGQILLRLLGGDARFNIDLIDPKVWIDFSSPEGTIDLFDSLQKSKAAVVSGTTGFNQKQIAKLKSESKNRSLLWSSNFSPGLWAVRQALKSMNHISEFDFAIHEIHHTAKKDIPSGTALTLQQDLEKTIGKKISGPPTGERIGGVFGIHTMTAASKNELIKIEHNALNRDVFAQGAIESAVWIVNQRFGYYSMDDFMETRK